jgi:hypothetical protein
MKGKYPYWSIQPYQVQQIQSRVTTVLIHIIVIMPLEIIDNLCFPNKIGATTNTSKPEIAKDSWAQNQRQARTYYA